MKKSFANADDFRSTFFVNVLQESVARNVCIYQSKLQRDLSKSLEVHRQDHKEMDQRDDSASAAYDSHDFNRINQYRILDRRRFPILYFYPGNINIINI